MCTTCYPGQSLVPLAGVGLVLVSLFGCLSVPPPSMSGVDLMAHQGYQGHRDYWEPRDSWGYRDYRGERSYRRPRSALPDRYTIYKGKKCQVRCERIRGSRDYRCREYRC